MLISVHLPKRSFFSPV